MQNCAIITVIYFACCTLSLIHRQGSEYANLLVTVLYIFSHSDHDFMNNSCIISLLMYLSVCFQEICDNDRHLVIDGTK